jgi:hypothetical protein
MALCAFFHHAGLVFYVVACYALHRLFCTTDQAIRIKFCLLQYMGFAAFAAGATIFKQGDTGEHFYIILTGAVDVSVHDDDPEKVNFAPPLVQCNFCMITYTRLLLLKLMHVQILSWQCAPIAQT